MKNSGHKLYIIKYPISTIVHSNIHILTHVQHGVVIKVPELPDVEICVSEQYPPLEIPKYHQNEVMSLRYL